MRREIASLSCVPSPTSVACFHAKSGARWSPTFIFFYLSKYVKLQISRWCASILAFLNVLLRASHLCVCCWNTLCCTATIYSSIVFTDMIIPCVSINKPPRKPTTSFWLYICEKIMQFLAPSQSYAKTVAHVNTIVMLRAEGVLSNLSSSICLNAVFDNQQHNFVMLSIIFSLSKRSYPSCPCEIMRIGITLSRYTTHFVRKPCKHTLVILRLVKAVWVHNMLCRYAMMDCMFDEQGWIWITRNS